MRKGIGEVTSVMTLSLGLLLLWSIYVVEPGNVALGCTLGADLSCHGISVKLYVFCW